MDIQRINEFSLALLEFVKRASRDGATAEEILALPLVAETLRWLTEQYGGGWPPEK